MNRCLLFAAVLWDPHRTPHRIEHHEDGSFTESWQWTAGEIERSRRVLAEHRDSLAALFVSPVPASAVLER